MNKLIILSTPFPFDFRAHSNRRNLCFFEKVPKTDVFCIQETQSCRSLHFAWIFSPAITHFLLHLQIVFDKLLMQLVQFKLECRYKLCAMLLKSIINNKNIKNKLNETEENYKRNQNEKIINRKNRINADKQKC